MLKEKICANFQRIVELFTQKIVTNLSKTWLWDPGSDIREKPFPDPGSRGQKGTGSLIPDPDPQHWLYLTCDLSVVGMTNTASALICSYTFSPTDLLNF